MTTNQDLALSRAVELVVSKAAGRPVTIASMQRLNDPDSRSEVFRCVAAAGAPPDSYVLKKTKLASLSIENQEDNEARRFINDWIGAEFLSSIPLEPPIGPRFYGGDLALGLYVMEDLGEHQSLVGPLLHGSAAEAETTLLRYSALIGRLHASTAGESARYAALFSAKLPGYKPFDNKTGGRDPDTGRVIARLDQFGIPVTGALAAEIEAVTLAVLQPGPFRVYIHSDPCPDNIFDLGDQLRLIDFETGHFGHALIDAVYPRMIWPSCWCASRLPAEVVTRMENRYRRELVRGCPPAQEDSVWETALVQACGYALINTFDRPLEHALNEDHDWGIATVRQRILSRMVAFIDTSESFHRLPALRGAASQLWPVLQARWPDTSPIPLYPAFA